MFRTEQAAEANLEVSHETSSSGCRHRWFCRQRLHSGLRATVSKDRMDKAKKRRETEYV